FREAAAFPLVFLTAYQMLARRARIHEGETILVLGAGSGVGSAAIQIARLHNCRVIATAGTDEKLEMATKLGADHVINHASDEIHEGVREFTKGWGADVVVEHVGEATWKSSLRSLARGGRLVTCGATTGPRVEINLRDLFWKQQSILGSTMGDLSSFRKITKLLQEGRVKPVLDRTFPMSAVREAHKYLEERKQFGKVVLVPDS
ncbi:MAG: zinc-binding dehydrogenase, partial [Candidatus Neomarinimicrobiota bacterium]